MGERRSLRLIVGTVGFIAGTEALHRRAEASAPPPRDPASCAVVALGFPTRANGAPNPVQRWRVQHAVRTMRDYGADVLVCTGGAVMNDWPEAETMAAVARRLGVAEHQIVIEDESPNSWENVKNTKPLTELADAVLLVSDPLHAARCRRYWLAQFPEDAGRVFVAPIDRSARDLWVILPSTVIEVARRCRDSLRRQKT